jgi:biopolymer transport protein TolR
MAIVVDGGGGDRKKPLHADLNLVPYIDLLTCMVAFLLITAVWTQLARLEVQQKGQGQEEGRPPSIGCASPSRCTTAAST